jgi:formamidopyrimidine-DNA glycosylase
VNASRIGKHVVLAWDEGRALGIHLMRAGRLHWKPARTYRRHAKRTRFAIELGTGEASVLEMTEAGTKHRAWVRAGSSVEALALERGGIDPLDPEFGAGGLARRLRAENRQIKSALRDGEIVAGIGNAYADEILFAARISPLRLTRALDDAELDRLAAAIPRVLRDWIERVRRACPDGLPVAQEEWRRSMAVHGRAGHPCPACGGIVARISFKDNETNYCPACQNEGRLLADRRLSRFGIRRPPRAAF